MRLATHDPGLRVAGICHMLAWEPGVIGDLLQQDYPLKLAMTMAYAKHARAERVAKNLVVDIGLGLICDMMIETENGTGYNPIGLAYHALGTGATAPAALDVQLGFEVRRKLITNRSRSSNVLELDTFYLAGECTFFIQECGVFGGSAASALANSGTLFSHYQLSYDNSLGVNDLTFSYFCTFGTL